MRYRKHGDEWIMPKRRGYKMRCCDCRLVHLMDFRIRKGRVEFRAKRDERATADSGISPQTERMMDRELLHALETIARGRPDCGRPLAGKTSRQIAREVLDKFCLRWPGQTRSHAVARARGAG